MTGPDPRKQKGFETPRDKYRNARRKEMEEEAELMKEAYGTRGAAMRKTASTMGEALAKIEKPKSDSTFVQKVKARVKKIID